MQTPLLRRHKTSSHTAQVFSYLRQVEATVPQLEQHTQQEQANAAAAATAAAAALYVALSGWQLRGHHQCQHAQQLGKLMAMVSRFCISAFMCSSMHAGTAAQHGQHLPLQD
jgi:hypothetical protein